MRFVGIDIGAERHVVAIVGEEGAVLTAATPCQEDAEGYRQLRAVLGDAADTLVATRLNPCLRAYDEQLRARGKHAKVALIAAMRKLLTAVYSVAKSKRPFVPHTKPREVPA